jgi:hypothetical protein
MMALKQGAVQYFLGSPAANFRRRLLWIIQKILTSRVGCKDPTCALGLALG